MIRAHLLLDTERAGVVCRLHSALDPLVPRLSGPRRCETVEAALALGQRLAHANSLAFALSCGALSAQLPTRVCGWRDSVPRRRSTSRGEHRLSQLVAHGTMCRGFALVGLGEQIERASQQLRTGLAGLRHGLGGRLLDTQWLGFIAEAHLRAGQFDDALERAGSRRPKLAAATGECYYQAELHRLQG